MGTLTPRLYKGKLLKSGYTTGTSAAAASKAAAEVLLSGEEPKTISILTPRGITVDIEVKSLERFRDEKGDLCVRAVVLKDGGDDIDATHGTEIHSIVKLANLVPAKPVVEIDGGNGVGRVTKPGLDQPVGNAAINSVPRLMIAAAVTDVATVYEYEGGFKVVIEIPDGNRIAQKTFNPKLGIVGGLSILGTSGIVDPMSNKALIATVDTELSVLHETGHHELLLTIGNYGEHFCRDILKIHAPAQVTSSNFVGDALSSAVEHGFDTIVVVGHIGKLVKLGIGLLNTHSLKGDGRIEVLIACALEAGADLETLHNLLDCSTTDAALCVLEAAGIDHATMEILGKRIQHYLRRAVKDDTEIAFICFTNAGTPRVLCQTDTASALLDIWR